MENTPYNVVAAWHDALNSGQVEQVVEMVSQDVEVGGTRGKTSGAAVVREWFGRANVRLLPHRYFSRENTVVVEEQGEWISPETGQVTGSQVVATVFKVAGAHITSIMRYDNLETALQAGGLDPADEVQA